MPEHNPESNWIWRLARRLLPRRYRELYSAELLRTHADRSGRAHGVAFWSAVLNDVLLTAAQLRFDALRSGSVAGSSSRNRVLDMWRHTALLAVRGVRHAPGFTFAVVATLALGIGANATMFRILDRLLLSPPQYVTDADQVRRVMIHGKIFGDVAYNSSMTYPDYRALRDVQSFSAVAANSETTLTLGHGSESERVKAELATASYFPLLGVRPLVGRFFTPDEDRMGAATPTAVLSYGFWQRRFGGDGGILGKTLDLGEGKYTVVGIAPEGFTGVDLAPIDVWLPLHAAGSIENGDEWAEGYGYYWLSVVTRLAPGSTEQQALVAAGTRYAASRASSPQKERDDPNARLVLAPVIAARGPEPTDETAVAKALGGVALLVLLIACANVANLFLARGVYRRKQFAVQSALGVTRGRLVLQMLMEATLLAVLAGVAAYILSARLAPVLFRVLLGLELPSSGDLRVPLITVALTLATALLGGLLPALRSSQVDVLEALRSGRSSLRSYAIRRALLGLQAALSVILLVGAGLFLRSLREANRLDFGMNTQAVAINFELDNGDAFGGSLAPVVYPALERLRAHPSVEYAAITSLAPFSGMWGLYVDIPGPDSVPRGVKGARFYAATADYFRVLGIPVLQGRVLTDADDRADAAPVAVVNQAMARVVWPNRDAIGQCLLIGPPRTKPSCTTVVGVVGDTRASVANPEANMTWFVAPHHPNAPPAAAQALLARIKGDPGVALPAIQSAARSAAPGIRFVSVQPLSESLRDEMRSWRLGATLLSAFGLLALLVAAAGMYSVLAFDVAQRRYELAVRSALGAAAPRLVRSILAQEMATAGAGVVVGLAVSLMLARTVSSMFFGVPPTDPRVYGSVIALMLAVAVFAAAVPAWRAARVDPRSALGME